MNKVLHSLRDLELHETVSATTAYFDHFQTSVCKGNNFIFPISGGVRFLLGYRRHSLLLRSLLASVQFSSVTQSCPTLCEPMNPSTPGLLVHHQLPEFTQTPVHLVRDAIQPSHPLSSPSPPAPNLSQHQSLFQ